MADEPTTLANVTGTNLADLISGDDPTLAESLRELLAEVDRSAEAISGWSSHIDS